MPEAVGPALARRRVKAESTKELLDLLNFELLAMYATEVKDLPASAEHLLDLLRQMPLEGQPELHPFGGAGLDIVEVDQVLLHRLKLASVWLRIGQDEQLGKGDLSHLMGADAPERAFNSSTGLYSGVYMFDAYLDPLLGALAPGVWGFAVVRTFGQLIFSFGRCLSGTKGGAAELLQLISIPGANEPTPMTSLGDGRLSRVSWKLRWRSPA